MDKNKLKDQILALALASTQLEPTKTERSSWQNIVDKLVASFIDELPTQKTFTIATSTVIDDFKKELGENNSLEQILSIIKKHIAQSGLLTAGPGHLGFIPGGGLYLGAVADHFAAALNSFSADAFASPIPAHIHNESIKWLCDLIGYDDKAWGDITSGGSQATLTSFFVAREARGIKPQNYSLTCIYIGEHTHHCAVKSLKILFADDIKIRKVPSFNHALDHKQLSDQIEKDIAEGLKPWLIVATLGCTSIGRVDPIEQISALAKKHQMWMHVDAAYGGFFKLCPESAAHFVGLENADSIVLDPHKGMFLPYGCGAVLFKDGSLLRKAFSDSGSYLQDRNTEKNELRSPMDYSFELTRPFRSLRLWLTIKIYGSKILSLALSEKLMLARYAYECLAEIKHIIIMSPLDLSVFCFRAKSEDNDDNKSEQLTKELLRRINLNDEVFLSSTVVDGYFVIRIAILSFRTHLITIENLIKIIEKETKALAKEWITK